MTHTCCYDVKFHFSIFKPSISKAFECSIPQNLLIYKNFFLWYFKFCWIYNIELVTGGLKTFTHTQIQIRTNFIDGSLDWFIDTTTHLCCILYEKIDAWKSFVSWWINFSEKKSKNQKQNAQLKCDTI